MYEDLYGDYGVSLFPRRFEPAPPGTPRPQVQPLAPEEEETMLQKAAGAGLGGLAFVGGTLEKLLGGRAIRAGLGLASGMDVDPTELLSIIPGSDLAGLTDAENRVGGRELLRHWGAAGPDDNWGNFFGGLGLELATDPASYMTFGTAALTGAGKAAQKAGMLPKTAAGRVGTTLADLTTIGADDFSRLGQVAKQNQTLADALRAGGKSFEELAHQPLGYSVGFGLPFKAPVTGLGESGLAAARLAGQGVGLLDKGLESIPLLGHQYGAVRDLAGKGLDAGARYGRALLDRAVLGATSALGQETAEAATGRIPQIVAQYKQKASQYADELAAHGLDPSGDVLRAVGEGTYDASKHGAVHPVIESVAQRMRGDLDEVLRQFQGLGINVQDLADLEANFLPRYASGLAKNTRGYGRPPQALATADPRIAGRKEFLKDIPGGSEAVNRLAADAAVRSASTDLEAAELVRRHYLGLGDSADPASKQVRLFQLQNLPEAQINPQLHPTGSPEWAQALANRQERDQLLKVWKQADDLAAWQRGLDPQYTMTPGMRFFGNHPLADYTTYFERAARVLASADAAHDLLARTAALRPQALATQGRFLPASKALEKAGLVSPAGTSPGAAAELLRRFNAMGNKAASIDDLHIPEGTVGEVTRYLRGFSAPDAVTAVGDAFDRATTLTKAFQTALWPAFHARNLLSGMWQNWVMGANEAPGGMLKAVTDAYKLYRGGVLDDAHTIAEYARRGLTPEQATRELAKEMYAWGTAGHLPHLARETIGPAGNLVDLGTDLPTFQARVLGSTPGKTVGQIAREYVPTSGPTANPLNVSGVGSNADLFAPVAAGRQLGDLVENVNRGSLYLSLRRQGFSAEEAAKRVIQSHFDYSRGAKTGFENAVMARAIPFYTFSRQNIPFQIEQLMNRPGGPSGLLAKAALDARQEGGFLPSYLGGGLAIPVGEEEGGVRRYLTRFDLPPEQAFEMIRGGPNWLPQSMMAVLGQTNPLYKAPVEYATGKQFYTGRDLGDLHGALGNQLLDQLLANSPLSRGATTVRTLLDERKWQDPYAALAIPLNLGTGVRLSDVDVQRAKDVAAREMVKAGLQGNEAVSKFETLAPKPGAEKYLTPEEWSLLRLARTLEQQAQERARSQKAAATPGR